MEHRDPDIVKLLLDHGLSASERQDRIGFRDGSGGMCLNLAERMMLKMEGKVPLSWQVRGAPSLESELRTFELLVSRGAHLCYAAMENVGLLITCDPPELRIEAHRKFFDEHSPNQIALAHRIMGRPHAALHGLSASTKTSYVPQKGENACAHGGASVVHLFGYRPIEATIGRLQLLTDAQVELECNLLRAQGLLHPTACESPADRRMALHRYDSSWDRGERASWCRDLSDGQTTPGPTSEWTDSKLVYETAGVKSFVVSGSDEVTIAPALGPVCIPIQVEGKPVYAFLSTVSALTIISKDFADHIGLRYIKLRTSNNPFFWRHGGNAECSLVPKLVVTLPGGLDVTLRTAVVVPNCRRGVQLGHDFFAESLR